MTASIPPIKNLSLFQRQLNAILALVSFGSTVATQPSATYTLALADNRGYLRHTNASPITVTVPPQSDVAWPANATISHEQSGVGQVTFVAGAGVTINKAASLLAKTAERYSVAQMVRTAADTWTLFGGLAS